MAELIRFEAQGNPECQAVLKKYLARAEQGDIAYVVALVARDIDGHVDTAFGGATRLEAKAKEGLEIVAMKMGENIKARALPPRDESLDASYVCFNLPNAPANYDFIAWLVDQEMIRIREGAPAPLKVAFWMGHDESHGLKSGARRPMWENVMKPAVEMIGGVLDDAALLGRCKEFYLTRDISAHARAGEKVPHLHAPEHSARMMRAWLWEMFYAARPVTVTLRNSTNWVHRNSKLDDWKRFAEDLRAAGEHVVVVQDTVDAHEPFHDFTVCPQASINVHDRMALYEQARMNFFVSNGPGTLCWYSDVPWRMFVEAYEDESNASYIQHKTFWTQQIGIPVDGQLPWAGPNQRFVWGQDTYENLTRTWQECVEMAVAAE